ncbi:type IV secretion system protein VirB8 [Sphingomonas sp. PP-F2F-G114-C0414]|uniref:virB8 family protein n=1 Tax=Sphingomonas sp. PP-F2F-G114-C0414 TaxID=2135662 RepID=UPI000EF86028|nr:type IV secretion system protein [Sphingomonas sp. PP-F2F-G114-C0414]RMB24880.1 type IV secretion system protein VirB8 [Sphingomonas sp. PP-F2F-G114-C0414]
MTDKPASNLKTYFREAETWNHDRDKQQAMWLRRAWMITAVTSLIAIFEAIALITLTPLKTVVPYTLLVDRQTGYVQALKPLDADMIAPDAALTRSFLAQYVIARAGFDIDTLKDDYRKVGLWSAGEARNSYIETMRATNPASPLASLPRGARIEVQIRGLSSLSRDTMLVRFTTARADAAGRALAPQLWSCVIRYRFNNAAMSAADRLLNPLGFQVIRYRQNADIAPSPPVAEEKTLTEAGSPFSPPSFDRAPVRSQQR